MKWLILLLLALPLYAQINGGLPAPIQSITSNADHQTVNAVQMPASVTSGNKIWGCVQWEDSTVGGTGSVTVSDNCTTTTYTMSSTVSVADSTRPGKSIFQQGFTGAVVSSCRPTYTETPSLGAVNSNMLVAEMPSNITTDGSIASSTATGTPSTMSTTATSALNGDVAMACTSAIPGISLQSAQAPSQFAASNGRGGTESLLSFTNLGAAGSQTITHITDNLCCMTMIMQLFKATAQSIVTTQLPEGGVGTAYSATVQDIGGSGSPTWSCCSIGSLPAGLSINAGTGAITGTPSVAGTSTFTLSDGVATKSLSIKIGATLGTPTIANFITSTVGVSATFNGVQAGDSIYIIGDMYDSGSYAGYIEPTSELHGTLGDTTYNRICPYTGGHIPGLVVYSGRTTLSGSDTISWTANGPGSPVGEIFLDVRGGQEIADCGAFATMAKAQLSLTLTTGTFNSVVPNTLLIAGCSVQQQPGSTVLSINSPFTSIAQSAGGIVGTLQQYSQNFVTATGNNTATCVASNLQTTGNNQVDSVLLFGIRAGIPAQVSLLGEKRKRRIY